MLHALFITIMRKYLLFIEVPDMVHHTSLHRIHVVQHIVDAHGVHGGEQKCWLININLHMMGLLPVILSGMLTILLPVSIDATIVTLPFAPRRSL
jgi:hypothetical protein